MSDKKIRDEISKRLIEYLKLKVENFKIHRVGKIDKITCPSCKLFNANLIPPFNTQIQCHNCGTRYQHIIDVVRQVEPQRAPSTDDEIIDYVCGLFSIPVITKSKITELFKFYEQNGFDLLPIQPNGKIPIEKEWTSRNHKESPEWWSWINNELNVGVKTGRISGITVVDIDSKNIPNEVWALLEGMSIVRQETKKGYHFFFKYDADLPKSAFNYPKDAPKDKQIHIDVENDGGQVVVYPSIVEGQPREFFIDGEIAPMPEAFKAYLLEHVKKLPRPELSNIKDESERINNIVSNFDIDFINEGNRTNSLIRLGGILRKTLGTSQVSNVLSLINQTFVKPPLPSTELHNIVGSLDKYLRFEEKDLAEKVLIYLKVVGDATARDVKEVVNERKEKVDKALAFLVKEGLVIKGSRGQYKSIRKANWVDTFPTHLENRFPYQFPYFYDIANFNWGDLVLLGSETKVGKTTISMNMVRSFVDQGIKPYYICLETGSRFIKTATKLNLKEGDFYWAFESDPTKIELEPNSVTILDWLLIEDKALTDVVMKYFVEQLYKTNGFLVVFMQLKEKGHWFAPNMINQFPCLSARYFYDVGGDGTTGHWKVDVIREPQSNVKTTEIRCKYDWETRRHVRIDDEQENNGQGNNIFDSGEPEPD